MMSVKIQILYMGNILCNRYHLVKTDDLDEMINAPTLAVLIQHPTLGNILYDTGHDPLWERSLSPDTKTTYPIREFFPITDVLQQKGLSPYDIDLVIISHLHFDHAGGLKYFAHTPAGQKVIVSKADLLNAYYSAVTGNAGAYCKQLFDVDGIIYSPIENELKLADDLTLFVQPSHTPGVIGMLVKTEHHGNIIFTCDTLYTSDSFEMQLPPGGHINKSESEFFDNLEVIKEMKAKYNATLFYGHDANQASEWLGKIID